MCLFSVTKIPYKTVNMRTLPVGQNWEYLCWVVSHQCVGGGGYAFGHCAPYWRRRVWRWALLLLAQSAWIKQNWCHCFLQGEKTVIYNNINQLHQIFFHIYFGVFFLHVYCICGTGFRVVVIDGYMENKQQWKTALEYSSEYGVRTMLFNPELASTASILTFALLFSQSSSQNLFCRLLPAAELEKLCKKVTCMGEENGSNL